jgi:hypothetical protein
MNLNLLLIINGLIIICLILNQNDNKKDLFNTENQKENPLEKITWFSFFFELILFLIKIKDLKI